MPRFTPTGTKIRRRTKAKEDDLLSKTEEIKKRVGFKSLSEEQVLAIVALNLTLKEMVVRNDLSAIALQCFPVFQKEFGIYPCLANSLLSNSVGGGPSWTTKR